MSAFADPEIIRMATVDFVPVAGDDWYQRRRQDAEGTFFRGVATRLGKTGGDGSSLQGIYLFAADGTTLGYKNAGGNPAVMREVLRDALRDFARLPAAKRAPGSVKVPDRGPIDPTYGRAPPEGGLILKVYTRILDFKDGGYCKGTCEARGGDKAARDHVWLTAAEVGQLAPAKLTVGARYPVPEKVAERLARFHLIDITRGEPPAWQKAEIRAKRFMLRVVSVTAEAVELRLDGEALMSTDADVSKAARGFDVRLLGELRYLPGKKTFDRFDVVAVGSHWGDFPDTEKARPGKSLVGISFELAADRPNDRIPPQGVRNPDQYYGRD